MYDHVYRCIICGLKHKAGVCPSSKLQATSFSVNKYGILTARFGRTLPEILNQDNKLWDPIPHAVVLEPGKDFARGEGLAAVQAALVANQAIIKMAAGVL